MTTNIYAPTASDTLSGVELELYHLIMNYRAQNGLGAIPLSNALTITAGRHAIDSVDNQHMTPPAGGNLHSWSDAVYPADHSQAQVMWTAPQRLGTGYPGNGYEISASGYLNVTAALDGWKASPGHNQVILSQGIWAPDTWTSIGIGVEFGDPSLPMGGRIYHVWFGEQADPTGGPRILGGDGVDNFNGTNFADLIDAGKGNETLSGGAGPDTFVWEVGDGNDIITDFSLAQDKIDLSSIAGINNINDLTINPNGGHAKIVLSGGSIVLNNVNAASLTGNNFKFSNIPGPVEGDALSDVNGDGKSDIVWRHTNGSVSLWEMNGETATAKTTLDVLSTAWKVNAVGDFNGDGNADFVWRHSDGRVSLWEMDGTTAEDKSVLGNAVSTAWKIIGSGDFNGDGNSDLLWRHTDGSVAIWRLDGENVLSKSVIAAEFSKSWKVAGADDFNGDGKDDILWRHTDGRIALWETNGTSATAKLNVGTTSTAWHIADTGDFTGDGNADILWRHNNGTVAIWEMDRADVLSKDTVYNALSTQWINTGVGDFGGDGNDDILFRNKTTGEVRLWEMDGADIVDNSAVGTVANSWQIFKEGFEFI